MKLNKLKETWNNLAIDDPYWAVLSWPEMKGKKWSKHKFHRTGEVEINNLVKYIKALKLSLKYNQALDFGCGVGRLTFPLAKHYTKVHGVDISASMLEIANKENTKKDKILFYVNDLPNLSIFEDEQMNLIYSNITLQHMPIQLAKAYIREFIRILSPHGVLVFQMPSHLKESFVNSSLKNKIVSSLPKQITDYYLSLKNYVTGQTHFDMHGIHQNEIISLIEKEGAKVIDVLENNEAGPKMISYRYTVVKS